MPPMRMQLLAAGRFETRYITGLVLNLNGPAMLLHDDIVADGGAKAGAFSGKLGRKER